MNQTQQQLNKCDFHQDQSVMFIQVKKDCQNPILCCRCVSENPKVGKLILIQDLLDARSNKQIYIKYLPILNDEINEIDENPIRSYLKESFSHNQQNSQQDVEGLFDQIKLKIQICIDQQKKELLNAIIQQTQEEDFPSFYQENSKLAVLANILIEDSNLLDKQKKVHEYLNAAYNDSDSVTKMFKERLSKDIYSQIQTKKQQIDQLTDSFIKQFKQIINIEDKMNNSQNEIYIENFEYSVENVEQIIQKYKNTCSINRISEYKFQQATNYNQLEIKVDNTNNNSIIFANSTKRDNKAYSSQIVENNKLYQVIFRIKNVQPNGQGHILIGLINTEKQNSEIYNSKAIKIFSWIKETDCKTALKGQTINEVKEPNSIFEMYFCVNKQFLVFSDANATDINYQKSSSNLFNKQKKYRIVIGIYNIQNVQELEILSIKKLQI